MSEKRHIVVFVELPEEDRVEELMVFERLVSEGHDSKAKVRKLLESIQVHK